MAGFRIRRVALVLILASVILAASGCGMLAVVRHRRFEPPTISFVGGGLTGLSLDGAELSFRMRIDNPNPIGLRFAGYDYALLVREQTIVQATSEEEADVPANGTTTVTIPISLAFRDLYNAVRAARDEDAVLYTLRGNLALDLPIVGRRSVAFERQGRLPLPKPPSIAVERLRIETLSPTRAQVVLTLRIDNPNDFALGLDRLRYALSVAGQEWANAEVLDGPDIAKKGSSRIDIPITLDIGAIGRSVAGMLRGAAPVTYRFAGEIDLTTTLPLLDRLRLPFELRDTLPLEH